MAILQAGRAGVVGLAGQVDPPASVRPDRTRDGDRLAQIDQAAALLDVQFDEGGNPSQRLVVAAGRLGDASGRAQRLGHRHAVAVAQGERAIGCQRAGDQPRTRAGNAEPGALLVGEVHHPDRVRRAQNPCCVRHPPRAAPRRRRAAHRTPRHRGPNRGGCRPRRRGHASGSPHQAHWLPARSSVTSSPRSAPPRRTTRAGRGPAASRQAAVATRRWRPGRRVRARSRAASKLTEEASHGDEPDRATPSGRRPEEVARSGSC